MFFFPKHWLNVNKKYISYTKKKLEKVQDPHVLVICSTIMMHFQIGVKVTRYMYSLTVEDSINKALQMLKNIIIVDQTSGCIIISLLSGLFQKCAVRTRSTV